MSTIDFYKQQTYNEISQFAQQAIEDGESDKDILDFLNEEFDEETVNNGLQQLNQDLEDALFEHRGVPSKPNRTNYKSNSAYKAAEKEYRKKLSAYNNRKKHEDKSRNSLDKANKLAVKANKERKKGGLHKLSAKYNQYKAGKNLYKSRKEAVKAGKYDAKLKGIKKSSGKYEAGAKWDKKVGYDIANKTNKKSSATKKGTVAGGIFGGSTMASAIDAGAVSAVNAAGTTTVGLNSALGAGLVTGATLGTAALGATVGATYAAGKHVYNRTKAGAALAKSKRNKKSKKS